MKNIGRSETCLFWDSIFDELEPIPSELIGQNPSTSEIKMLQKAYSDVAYLLAICQPYLYCSKMLLWEFVFSLNLLIVKLCWSFDTWMLLFCSDTRNINTTQILLIQLIVTQIQKISPAKLNIQWEKWVLILLRT